MELTIEQLIKIIVGVFVVVIVVISLYFFFKNYVIDFFNNTLGGNITSFVLFLLK
ncbi:MAG: hypothetical protein KJ646_01970 [Nanoarchaeota archaeon]|nr:hypothetical protein [Nanoarchaeota archaeon]MBU4116851.1 hypothetical protein [Nanoarchaeota archaeon]